MPIKKLTLTDATPEEAKQLHDLMPHLFEAPAPQHPRGWEVEPEAGAPLQVNMFGYSNVIVNIPECRGATYLNLEEAKQVRARLDYLIDHLTRAAL